MTDCTALIHAAQLLLALEDGPRDDYYEAAKPAAWENLRLALAETESAFSEGLGT